ncbi:hypothetical protein DVH24_036031 [Malus domestica]|uniref:Uncharacterized protein n=1 Tax=Malus domestica TaxID=3750 RepID=A0A498JTX2_MALDO|nr:hypothetical protein DVH24_036031 [Malus domestica]
MVQDSCAKYFVLETQSCHSPSRDSLYRGREMTALPLTGIKENKGGMVLRDHTHTRDTLSLSPCPLSLSPSQFFLSSSRLIRTRHQNPPPFTDRRQKGKFVDPCNLVSSLVQFLELGTLDIT